MLMFLITAGGKSFSVTLEFALRRWMKGQKKEAEGGKIKKNESKERTLAAIVCFYRQIGLN